SGVENSLNCAIPRAADVSPRTAIGLRLKQPHVADSVVTPELEFPLMVDVIELAAPLRVPERAKQPVAHGGRGTDDVVVFAIELEVVHRHATARHAGRFLGCDFRFELLIKRAGGLRGFFPDLTLVVGASLIRLLRQGEWWG